MADLTAAETATAKTIIVIGGSYSGISTAHYLLKHVIPKLPQSQEYQVVLLSASSDALCRPACPRAMIADEMFDQSKLFVKIEDQFKQYTMFRFVHGAATKLNHQQREVTVRTSEAGAEIILLYYALIIATGSSTRSPLLGLNTDSQNLRRNWQSLRQALPLAKHIVIAGGGPAGVEIAGELGEYLNGSPSWFGRALTDAKVKITLVTSASQLLPALRPSIAAKAEPYLAQLGVTVRKDCKVIDVEPKSSGVDDVAAATSITLEDGTKLEADIYIPAIGTSPNTLFVDSSLLTDDVRIETNPTTLRVDKAGPRVYAIGDVSSAARPAIHVTFEQIPVLCANVKRDLLLACGQDEEALGGDRIFKEDTRETQMVLIGKSVGLGAAMGWALPSWVVKMIKRNYWLWTTADLWSGKQWNKEK